MMGLIAGSVIVFVVGVGSLIFFNTKYYKDHYEDFE